jgi:methylmalonyl-CoA mutase N-terminal domain/subunit
MEKAWLTYQKKVENKERIVVGVNEFTVPEEDDKKVPVYHHQVGQELVQSYINSVKKLKKTRSQQRLRKALDNYRSAAEKGGQNLLPYVIKCCRAHATTAEVRGAYRMAKGLSYDPYNMMEYPFQ